MKKIIGRLIDLIYLRDFEYAEFQGGLIAMLWGLWLMNPWSPDIFAVYSAYRIMALIAPDYVWGLAFLLISLGQLTGLIYRVYQVRRWASFLACAIWMFVWILFLLTAPFFLGTPTVFMFSVGAAWGYLRIGSDERRRKCI